ncbi:MAG: serine hydrolase [Gammaproteobacteria bacterium]
MKARLCVLLVALFLNVGALAQTITQPADLDAYVHKAMAQWRVPGLAVAIVKDGKVVFARGYGVRELGKPGKVGADTLFTIGSVSKQFTVAALGTLVSAGKLQWDAPVTQYLKNFQLSSPYVTQNIMLSDLLSHRSGYCDPQGMWYTADDTAANVIQRLRYQTPDYGFRAHFCYNNTMYLAASLFIPAITGESWNDYVAQHLFAPLNMTRTDTTEAAVEAATNAAIPHAKVDGKVEVIQRYWANNMDVFAPVGGINSSVDDMSHWLEMLLADGKYDGKTVLDPDVIHTMETPQIPIPAHTWIGDWLRTQTPDSHFYAYGFGFMLQDYGKYKVVWHAGDINGMATAMALVPSEHLGVIALSNMDQNRAPEGVVFHVLQSYLGLPHFDVSQAMYDARQKENAKDKMAQEKLADTRQKGARAPRPLSAYAGAYQDDFYGTAHVSVEQGHLVLRLGNPRFTGNLEPWHDNTFRVTWRDHYYDKNYVTFDLDAYGKPDKLSFALMPLHYQRVENPAVAASQN